MAEQKNSLMGITSLIGWLFGADAAAAPDATKLDGTTEVALARSFVGTVTGRTRMDQICRGAYLVLDQGRSIRVWRNGR